MTPSAEDRRRAEEVASRIGAIYEIEPLVVALAQARGQVVATRVLFLEGA